MIASISVIISQHTGMTRQAACTLLILLVCMKYHIRMAYGVVSESFSNVIKWLLRAIQGDGHSGSLWALTTSVMFDQMEERQGTEL